MAFSRVFFALSLLALLIASGPLWATPLDLQYQPEIDQPQSDNRAPEPPLLVKRARHQSTAMAADQQGAGKQYGWQWLSPSVSLSSRLKDSNSPEAAKIAQQQMDHQLLMEHHEPLLNDLPPALQTLPITVNFGVKYHF